MSITEFTNVLPKNSYTLFDMDDNTYKRVEERLFPGAYSGVGFIQLNDSFKDVVIKDLRTLNRLGISCDKIYHTILAHIEKERNASKKREGRPIEVIIGLCSNGYQKCPFETKSLCHKGRQSFTLTNNSRNESITVTDLGINLIRHAFFQNSIYRIDPEKLCRLLELTPGEYQTRTESRLIWVTGDEYNPENEIVLQSNAKKSVIINPSATAYFGLPFHDIDNTNDVESEKTYCHILIKNEDHLPLNKGTPLDGKVLMEELIFEGHFVFLETDITMALI